MKSPDNMIPPKKFIKEGYELAYIGNNQTKHRHYPNSFITAHYVDGELVWKKDNRRNDTIKSLPYFYHVFEYVKEKEPK